MADYYLRSSSYTFYLIFYFHATLCYWTKEINHKSALSSEKYPDKTGISSTNTTGIKAAATLAKIPFEEGTIDVVKFDDKRNTLAIHPEKEDLSYCVLNSNKGAANEQEHFSQKLDDLNNQYSECKITNLNDQGNKPESSTEREEPHIYGKQLEMILTLD